MQSFIISSFTFSKFLIQNFKNFSHVEILLSINEKQNLQNFNISSFTLSKFSDSKLHEFFSCGNFIVKKFKAKFAKFLKFKFQFSQNFNCEMSKTLYFVKFFWKNQSQIISKFWRFNFCFCVEIARINVQQYLSFRNSITNLLSLIGLPKKLAGNVSWLGVSWGFG